MTRIYPRKWFVYTGILLLCVIGINAGHWIRNQSTFGSPFGTSQRISQHANGNVSPGGVASNLLRNATLHLGTPWPTVNHELFRLVVGVHFKLGVDPNDPRTTYTNEFRILPLNATDEYTGNPIHFILYLGSFVWLVLFGRKEKKTVIFACVIAATFLVYSIAFKWIVFGSRYELPFFVMFSSIVGKTFSMQFSTAGLVSAGLLLSISAIPWLVGIETRPIFPIFPDSQAESIFHEEREDLYLYGYRQDYKAYKMITERILAASCKSIGLEITGGGPEYIWWMLSGAPFNSTRIKWIVSGTASEKYSDPGFAPCAVICDATCPEDWLSIRGLPIDTSLRNVRLFMKSKK